MTSHRSHAIFFIPGNDEQATLCRRNILVQRTGEKISGFLTEAGHPIQCHIAPRNEHDVTCINCRCVLRNPANRPGREARG